MIPIAVSSRFSRGGRSSPRPTRRQAERGDDEELPEPAGEARPTGRRQPAPPRPRSRRTPRARSLPDECHRLSTTSVLRPAHRTAIATTTIPGSSPPSWGRSGTAGSSWRARSLPLPGGRGLPAGAGASAPLSGPAIQPMMVGIRAGARRVRIDVDAEDRATSWRKTRRGRRRRPRATCRCSVRLRHATRSHPDATDADVVADDHDRQPHSRLRRSTGPEPLPHRVQSTAGSSSTRIRGQRPLAERSSPAAPAPER